MNVNEVLANRALQLRGSAPGALRPDLPSGRPQPAPVHQRHLSHGAAAGRHPAAAHAGGPARRPAGSVPGLGTEVRPRGQGRAHGDAGRGAHHPRPGDGRLRGGPQPGPLAGLQVRGAAAGGQPGRHRDRHRPGRAAAVHLPGGGHAAGAHRHRLRPGGEPGGGHAERGRVRGGLRDTQGLRRHSAQDLQATCACCPRGRKPASARSGCRSGRPGPASCRARSTR